VIGSNRLLVGVGAAAFVLGTIGALLFGFDLAADHRLEPRANLTSSTITAITASDTAWMWGCIAVGVLGAALIVVMVTRIRRGY
jgi:hypothetical protein